MESNHYRFYDNAFGKNPVLWKSASPFHALTAGTKPILAVCSSIRPDSPCNQARRFSEKAANLGVRVEISEQAMSHAQINKVLGTPGAYTDTVESFMASLDEKMKEALSRDSNGHKAK